MEEAIRELFFAIVNNISDLSAAISALCSVVSLMTIVILLIERSEKKRPYLQVSFELIRDKQVCLIIRNVGEVPAKLKGVIFNEDFIKQLPENGRRHARDRDKINISIYPKQHWVICLDTITSNVLSYKNKQLEVTLKYTSKEKKKEYKETEIINFEDYRGFLVYISEVDELKKSVEKVSASLDGVSRKLNRYSDDCNAITEIYSRLEDACPNAIVTGYENEEQIKETSKEDETDEK